MDQGNRQCLVSRKPVTNFFDHTKRAATPSFVEAPENHLLRLTIKISSLMDIIFKSSLQWEKATRFMLGNDVL
jgi:hypothetical protein